MLIIIIQDKVLLQIKSQIIVIILAIKVHLQVLPIHLQIILLLAAIVTDTSVVSAQISSSATDNKPYGRRSNKDSISMLFLGIFQLLLNPTRLLKLERLIDKIKVLSNYHFYYNLYHITNKQNKFIFFIVINNIIIFFIKILIIKNRYVNCSILNIIIYYNYFV